MINPGLSLMIDINPVVTSLRSMQERLDQLRGYL